MLELCLQVIRTHEYGEMSSLECVLGVHSGVPRVGENVGVQSSKSPAGFEDIS